MSRRLLTKLLVALGVLTVLAYLFVRSVQDTRTAPYAVEAQHLQGWTLAVHEASRGSEPLLLLQPPRQLPSALSRQVFTRSMESQSVPPAAGIALLLREEFERSFARQASPQALLEAARATGIETMPVQPRCLGLRRESRPGQTRQVYFVLFDAPDVARVRGALAAGLDGGAPAPDAFDPAALSPVMLVAASDADFGHWLPLRAEQASDCVAPIEVQ
jgi:hypothetical protein